jgi:threonine dehydratase
MSKHYLERILTARVYDVADETPLEFAPAISARLGNAVYLKREDMQPVFSFKLRGAYNKMVRLPRAALKRGVIAASAGNHAQGVALAAQKLGCKATIVMPVTTPQIKIQAVATRGARVVLHGDSYDEAYAHSRALAAKAGLTFVHPYDDPDVIAGQGTIAMAYVKRLRPEIRVIGVEPTDADAMYRSLKAGRRIKLSQVGLFADGVAVKQVGSETFRLCRELVDEVILVDTDEICAAIKDVFEDTRSILEPAGALGIAGAKRYVERGRVRGQTLAAIASGANMNFDRLRFVAEEAELGEHREALLAVTIPERPGSFRAFCEVIGARNITEFNYRFNDLDKARVFVGMQVRDRAETAGLIARLRRHRLTTLDLSDNELAKLHIRHTVGGHAPAAVGDEILYRFEFPERPGALMKFLNAMSHGWNISLFHYRNHGADYGRVLVGMQVPAAEQRQFQAFLRQVGYPYWNESRNPAYQLFLR